MAEACVLRRDNVGYVKSRRFFLRAPCRALLFFSLCIPYPVLSHEICFVFLSGVEFKIGDDFDDSMCIECVIILISRHNSSYSDCASNL